MRVEENGEGCQVRVGAPWRKLRFRMEQMLLSSRLYTRWYILLFQGREKKIKKILKTIEKFIKYLKIFIKEKKNKEITRRNKENNYKFASPITIIICLLVSLEKSVNFIKEKSSCLYTFSLNYYI